MGKYETYQQNKYTDVKKEIVVQTKVDTLQREKKKRMPTCSRKLGEVKDISDNTKVSIMFFNRELLNFGVKPE